MARAMKPADLFATPIALFDDVYSNPEEVIDAAVEAVRGQRSPKGWLCDIQSSFNSNTKIAEQLPQFNETILKAANQYSQQQWKKDCIIESSWANIARSYQYQEQHHHIANNPHTKFCAVYYPQCQPGEQITFHSPYMSIVMLDPGRNVVSLNVKPNRLIVFPVYLEHSFKAIERTVDKISVAFNFALM